MKLHIDQYEEPDILECVDIMRQLLGKFDSMIILDAVVDHLGARSRTDDEQFQVDVLEHAIKEIRKSRGLE